MRHASAALPHSCRAMIQVHAGAVGRTRAYLDSLLCARSEVVHFSCQYSPISAWTPNESHSLRDALHCHRLPITHHLRHPSRPPLLGSSENSMTEPGAEHFSVCAQLYRSLQVNALTFRADDEYSVSVGAFCKLSSVEAASAHSTDH